LINDLLGIPAVSDKSSKPQKNGVEEFPFITESTDDQDLRMLAIFIEALFNKMKEVFDCNEMYVVAERDGEKIFLKRTPLGVRVIKSRALNGNLKR